jgi:hypothetical protein
MNNMNPQNQKMLIGAALGIAALYGSYLYGQKNPKRNVLDMPP